MWGLGFFWFPFISYNQNVSSISAHVATVKIKVKCTFVQALRLSTDHTAHRGSRGIALLFLEHGTRWGWGVSVTPGPLFIPKKDPVPIVQEAGWVPGPVWTGAENLAPPGFDPRIAQPLASRLYRLSYPAQTATGTDIYTYIYYPEVAPDSLLAGLQCGVCFIPPFWSLGFWGGCYISVHYVYSWDTWWRSCLRHCATSRQVAVSIPDGIIGIFHNPSGRTMALGLTQPLTEMSTRNISWG